MLQGLEERMAGASLFARALMAADSLDRLSPSAPDFRFLTDCMLDRILSALDSLGIGAPARTLPQILDPSWYDLLIPVLDRKAGTLGDRRPRLIKAVASLRRDRRLLALFARDLSAFVWNLPGEDQDRARDLLLESDRESSPSLEEIAQTFVHAGLESPAHDAEKVMRLESEWAIPRMDEVTCLLVQPVPLPPDRAHVIGVLGTLQVAPAPDGPEGPVWHNAVFPEGAGEEGMIFTAKDAACAARAWAERRLGGRTARGSCGFVLSFREKTSLYAGSSVGLAVGVGISGVLMRRAGRRTAPVPPPGWAFTGGLSPAGLESVTK